MASPQTPGRRRAPRRQLVIPVAIERRRANRREDYVGSDGLRRTVLADDWRISAQQA